MNADVFLKLAFVADDIDPLDPDMGAKLDPSFFESGPGKKPSRWQKAMSSDAIRTIRRSAGPAGLALAAVGALAAKGIMDARGVAAANRVFNRGVRNTAIAGGLAVGAGIGGSVAAGTALGNLATGE